MVKHLRIPRVHRNRTPGFSPGDVYDIDNTITRRDVNNDGVADLVIDHVVLRNGEFFFKTQSTWYGVDDATYNLFDQNIAPSLKDFKTKNFGEVVGFWQKMGEMSAKITGYGSTIAAKIGQPAR